jgi:hypothetical protein
MHEALIGEQLEAIDGVAVSAAIEGAHRLGESLLRLRRGR